MWRPLAFVARPRVEYAAKVYVSPHPLDLPEAVSACITASTGLPVVGIKYGLDVYGMLRPDKLVVYLAELDAVEVLAKRLLAVIGGLRTHGVPFTAELGGNGLISWGIDPPRDSEAATLGGSWRQWITRVLALGLTSPDEPATEPWERALRGLAKAGVDPLTWAPKADLWTAPAVA